MPPPAEIRKRPLDGISQVQKVAAVELGFRGAPGCLRDTWTDIGGRSMSVEQQGAHEGGGRAWGGGGVGAPPTSWPPCWLLDVGSKSPGSCLVRKSCSRRFHSVWTPFDIPFLRNPKIGKKTAIWAGPPISRLVSKMI